MPANIETGNIFIRFMTEFLVSLTLLTLRVENLPLLFIQLELNEPFHKQTCSGIFLWPTQPQQ